MNRANADEAAFWNAEAGENWVAHQPDMDTLFAGVTEALIAAAAPQAGEAVVDIGCGAGGSTFVLAGRVGPAGSVTGARRLGAAPCARRGAAAGARGRERPLRAGRRPGPPLRGRARPRDLALRRDVLRRPAGGLPQHRRRSPAGRAAGLRRLGRPGAQSLVRSAAAGGGGAARAGAAGAGGRARPDGLPRRRAGRRADAGGGTKRLRRRDGRPRPAPSRRRRHRARAALADRHPAQDDAGQGCKPGRTQRRSSMPSAPGSTLSAATTASASRPASTSSPARLPTAPARPRSPHPGGSGRAA